MGMIGRPSVVHFATITHWTHDGQAAERHSAGADSSERPRRRPGIENGDAIRVESPRGSISGDGAAVRRHPRGHDLRAEPVRAAARSMGEEIGLPLYEPANTLVDDRYFDNLSGQQAYKCFACRVRRA